MKRKKCTRRLVAYEIRNLLGNPFVYIFGIFLPVLLLFIITRAIEAETPELFVAQANTSVFITMSLIVPMAVILIGYAANYAQELEKEIPLRMELFGYNGRAIFLAKIIAHFIVVAVGIALYTCVAYMAVDLQVPQFRSALCLIFCHFLLETIFFALAHGIATFFKKFGPTYAVVMALYFGIMITCGMMGIQTDMLPLPVRKTAMLLPMSYISSDFIDFWTEGSYNFVPMIQSFLFFGAIAGVVLVFAMHRNRRKSAV